MGQHVVARYRQGYEQHRDGPVDGSVLWQGFGGNCERNNDGDPIVLFDRTVKRWCSRSSP
jgi:hypothetical protein